jgi:hypothetical protein
MTSKYTDKQGEEKTRWSRVGVAFPNEKLGGYRVILDAPTVFIPGVNDLMLATPKPKDGAKVEPAAAPASDDVAF